MMIIIGQTADDRRVLHKNFNGTDITVQLKQPCDILNPVFVLTWRNDYIAANYIHCADLGRYYFVDNVVMLPGNRAEIHCSVDVLMSYANQIDGIRCVVSRQQAEGLSLVPDSNIMIQNYNPVDVYNFPNFFDTSLGSYVLQVIGGV